MLVLSTWLLSSSTGVSTVWWVVVWDKKIFTLYDHFNMYFMYIFYRLPCFSFKFASSIPDQLSKPFTKVQKPVHIHIHQTASLFTKSWQPRVLYIMRIFLHCSFYWPQCVGLLWRHILFLVNTNLPTNPARNQAWIFIFSSNNLLGTSSKAMDVK